MILYIVCAALLLALVIWLMSNDVPPVIEHPIKLDGYYIKEISEARLELEYRRGYIQGCCDVLEHQFKPDSKSGTPLANNQPDTNE